VRRIKLIWFAGGAAAVLCSYFLASFFFPEKRASSLSLILLAPDVFPENGPESDLDSVQFTTGGVIRSCRTNEFRMHLSPHHGIGYEIPISLENRKELECVLRKLRVMDKSVTPSIEVR
jgi:hypothetical protein